MLVSSTANSTVKRVRALTRRKEREAAGTFFAEGIRVVAAAAEAGAEIEMLVVAPDLLASVFARDLVQRLHRGGVPVLEVTPPVFRALATRENPQGLGAVVRQRWTNLDQARASEGLCWVALEAVADPGNLGTILRTCDAVGAAGVVLLGPSTDPHDPAAVRASMGAVFYQHLVRTPFPDLLAWARRHEVAVVGTSDAAPTDYQALTYPHPLVLLMGSEREGLPAEQQAACGDLVRVPMAGHVDSLNVAVAAGVVLYEVFNQQRAPAGRPGP